MYVCASVCAVQCFHTFCSTVTLDEIGWENMKARGRESLERQEEGAEGLSNAAGLSE